MSNSNKVKSHTKNLESMRDDIVSSIDKTIPHLGLRCPEIGKGPDDFTWLYRKTPWWTDSFWTGQLWLAFTLTGSDKYLNQARARYSYLLKGHLEQPLWQNHDMGFLFSLSAVADYQLTGNKEARALALRAADMLRARFNHNGQYIVAWTPGCEGQKHAEACQGKIIIDCMENLPLLLWAYQETGVQSYKEVALAQADTSLKYLVRDDYSTYHSYDFDTTTNAPLKGKTVQGYADESCWSRGQSWAIHGFAQMAKATGELGYAIESAKLADYVIEHITDDLIPVWDYLLPEHEIQYKDTSAGAVTSAGMFLLAEVLEFHGKYEESRKYSDFALKMLIALREKYDLTHQNDAYGLLSNGASFVKNADEQNQYLANAMLPYGDYYYFEATLRALGHTRFFW
jgi:unsaturated chondroitin disaccharide hydrolase